MTIFDHANPPSPADVRRARGARTQAECAKLLHAGLRSWRQWEAGDRRMHPAMWELFLIKTGQKS